MLELYKTIMANDLNLDYSLFFLMESTEDSFFDYNKKLFIEVDTLSDASNTN